MGLIFDSLTWRKWGNNAEVSSQLKLFSYEYNVVIPGKKTPV